MPLPDPLKSYRLYVAMFLLNLSVVIGVIYLLRRDQPRTIVITTPPPRPSVTVGNSTTARITVAISGAVNQPGTLQLDSTARLADALQRAGVKPEADLSALNLTRPLKDGDKINVPVRASDSPAANTLTGVTSPPAAPTALNLNTATLTELDALPGIGPTLAQRILDYRAAKGSFTTVDELKEVRGIGDVLFDNLKELITVQ